MLGNNKVLGSILNCPSVWLGTLKKAVFRGIAIIFFNEGNHFQIVLAYEFT